MYRERQNPYSGVMSGRVEGWMPLGGKRNGLRDDALGEVIREELSRNNSGLDLEEMRLYEPMPGLVVVCLGDYPNDRGRVKVTKEMDGLGRELTQMGWVMGPMNRKVRKGIVVTQLRVSGNMVRIGIVSEHGRHNRGEMLGVGQAEIPIWTHLERSGKRMEWRANSVRIDPSKQVVVLVVGGIAQGQGVDFGGQEREVRAMVIDRPLGEVPAMDVGLAK